MRDEGSFKVLFPLGKFDIKEHLRVRSAEKTPRVNLDGARRAVSPQCMRSSILRASEVNER